MTSLRLQAEELAIKAHRGDLWNPEDISKAILEAFEKIRNEALEEAAKDTEDKRYDLPGREAEWCRFIARNIRALKEPSEESK